MPFYLAFKYIQMSKRSSNKSSRRKFIRDTSLATTGFFILPNDVIKDFGASNNFAATPNPTQLENAKAGTTAWQLTNPAVNREVEGYASLTSVNRGGQIRFFISVAQAQLVNLQIYRMGWYGGNGGRQMATTTVTAITQSTPAPDANGLVDCNWTSQYTLNIPNNTTDLTDWASGIYLVKLTAQTSGKQSYIIFVVRDDARASDFLYQASFSTYQAYNNWPYARNCGAACTGSKSLYPHNSNGEKPAWKVSFNRPYAVGLAPKSELGVGAGEFLTNVQPGAGSHEGAGWEYNLVRWLEMKGYDITYASSIDTHEKADLFLNGTQRRHKGFISSGHDEYWSWQMRQRVEQARDNGVSLGFFSSNVCYWQVRFEASLRTGQANRTMVSYKYDAGMKDPYYLDSDAGNNHLVTTWWRESPVNKPEASMVGVMFWGNSYLADMVVTNPSHWAYSGTNLVLNERLPGLIGYECDSVVASSPSNIQIVAHSPVVDTRYADTTIYTVPSGAVVFAAGSNQFSWGLDDFYASGTSALRPPRLNTKFQQMISNILSRFVGNQFPVSRVGGPYNGVPGTPVSFNGSGSSDADGTIVSYNWTFGDGTTGTGATPTHIYSSAGTYTVNLVVIDDDGAAHSSSTKVTVGTTSTPSAVDAPTGLNAVNGKGNSSQVKLNWDDNSDNEQFFHIERSLTATSGFSEIGRVTADIVDYADKNIQKSTRYYYRVRASNGTVFSGYSNIVTIVTAS